MTTPDVPEAAVEAAAKILRDVALVGTYWTLSGSDQMGHEEAMDRAGDLGAAAAILVAAAPHIRADERARVLDEVLEVLQELDLNDLEMAHVRKRLKQ